MSYLGSHDMSHLPPTRHPPPGPCHRKNCMQHFSTPPSTISPQELDVPLLYVSNHHFDLCSWMPARPAPSSHGTPLPEPCHPKNWMHQFSTSQFTISPQELDARLEFQFRFFQFQFLSFLLDACPAGPKPNHSKKCLHHKSMQSHVDCHPPTITATTGCSTRIRRATIISLCPW